jgi:hypothetical protein
MAQAASEGRELLSEPEAKAVLAAFGVPVAETVVADSVEAVEAVAADLLTRHDALAVKIVSRDITHKSDVGGVTLNLDSPKAARQAARDIAERAAAARPDARIDGFAVQAMIRRPRCPRADRRGRRGRAVRPHDPVRRRRNVGRGSRRFGHRAAAARPATRRRPDRAHPHRAPARRLPQPPARRHGRAAPGAGARLASSSSNAPRSSASTSTRCSPMPPA